MKHSLTNQSLIDDLFGGQIVNARRCQNCGNVDVDTETFRLLLIPLAKGSEESEETIVPLSECIQSFVKTETVTDVHCYHCSNQSLSETPETSENEAVIEKSPSARCSSNQTPISEQATTNTLRSCKRRSVVSHLAAPCACDAVDAIWIQFRRNPDEITNES
jgi:hypothetical protein